MEAARSVASNARSQLTAALTFMICGSTALASTDASVVPCQDMEIRLPKPFAGTMSLAEIPIRYVASVSYRFSLAQQEGVELMKIEEVVGIDMNDLRNKWPAIASQKVPTSSCENRYSPGGFGMSVSEGKAVGHMNVTYEDWTCGWTWGTCSTTGYRRVAGVRVPYPKLYKCRWETKNKWFQKTVGVDTYLAPRPVDDELNIEIDSHLDDRGGIPDALLNVVGVMTFDVGSKYMRDQYRSIISDVKSQLPHDVLPVDMETGAAGATDLRDIANLHLDHTYFDNADQQLTLNLISAGRTKRNTGCFLQRQMISQSTLSAVGSEPTS